MRWRHLRLRDCCPPHQSPPATASPHRGSHWSAFPKASPPRGGGSAKPRRRGRGKFACNLSVSFGDSIPTPFVPSGHFPLIGGIGPWKGSREVVTDLHENPNRKFSLRFGKEETSTEDKKPCLQGFVPSWSFLTRLRRPLLFRLAGKEGGEKGRWVTVGCFLRLNSGKHQCFRFGVPLGGHLTSFLLRAA